MCRNPSTLSVLKMTRWFVFEKGMCVGFLTRCSGTFWEPLRLGPPDHDWVIVQIQEYLFATEFIGHTTDTSAFLIVRHRHLMPVHQLQRFHSSK
jgi:hypothetical protein